MITQEKIQEIVNDRLNNHLSLQKLARKHRFTWTTIKSILLSTNNYQETRHAPWINKWDFDFFEQSNPVTAYWSGFMYADGCVSNKKHGVRLHAVISNKDFAHLESFAKTIHFPIDKIRIEKNGTRVIQLNSHDRSILMSLCKWGIVERKSYNFVEPQIADNLVPHFLRGWFDGDGHLAIKQRYQRFEVVGNSSAIDWYVQKLRKLGFNGHISVYGPQEKVWRRFLVTGKNQIAEIAEMLFAFDEVVPKLHRKWLPILSVTPETKKARTPPREYGPTKTTRVIRLAKV